MALATSSIHVPANQATLEKIGVQLSNHGTAEVEFSQVMTLYRVDAGQVTATICEFGSSASPPGPGVCDLDADTWFPLLPGSSVGNASAAPLFLPVVGVNLEAGDYVAAVPIRLPSGAATWLETAVLHVSST